MEDQLNSSTNAVVMQQLPSVNQNTFSSVINPKKPPFPWLGIWGLSFFFGAPGAFLMVWQNLKRMGKFKEANEFFVWGGIGLVILSIAVIFFIPTYPSGGWRLSPRLSNLLGMLFALPFYFRYKNWEKENPGVVKRNWTIVGWGALGLVLLMTIDYLINIL